MTKGQYPTIKKGIGNLSPDLWRRMMDMLRKFENTDRDERAARLQRAFSIPFMARLTDAKCVAVNKYIYAWTKVKIDDGDYVFIDTTTTSTGENDKWDYSALNLVEANNTSTKTATGVDEDSGNFPAGFNLQAIGGGFDKDVGDTIGTLGVEPVVMMWKMFGRHVFNVANSYDGGCS